MARDRTARRTIARAERLLRDGEYADGAVLLEKAVKRFPKDPEIRLLLGTFLVAVRPDDAAEQLAESIRLDIDDPIRLTRAAGMLFALGYVDGAASYVARAIDLAPDGFLFESDALNVSGLVAAARGHDELAEESLKKAIELDRSNEFFVRDLARFLSERDRKREAAAVVEEAIPHVRDTAPLIDLRGELGL